jgi:L-asparagine oxygenase
MGIILFKDVEIGHVPKTPATPFPSSVAENSLKIAAETLLKYAHEFGHPVSYIQEQQGQLIQNIVPVHKTESQQISTSSKVELGLHTETAFHPYKPDYVILLCLRGDPKAITTYASLPDILKHVSTASKHMLMEKMFTTGIDLSFRTNGEEDREIPISIISKGANGRLSFTYDVTVIKGESWIAKELLEEVQWAIEQCTQEIALKTGDLLVIDNRNTIHGRKPFQARYDGTDRWVQRVLVRKELPPADQIDGHVITTEF